MPKMSIADAAEYFGVSREAIHNRIRRGSLEAVVEDGVKLVEVSKTAKPRRATSRTSTAKINVSDSRYYKLLEEQNAKLQARVETLEGETRSLRDQKELMLIEERIKIEQIYKDKDEQLKNILSSLTSQFMLNSPAEVSEVPKIEEETLEAEIEIETKTELKSESKVISLKKYLKINKISEKKAKKIKAKFKKEAQRDNRIITIGKKHYINLSKYDYENLLN